MRIQVLRAAIWDRASMRAAAAGWRTRVNGWASRALRRLWCSRPRSPCSPSRMERKLRRGVLSRGMPMVRLTWPASGGRAVSTVGARSAEGSTMATRSRDRSPASSRMCRTYWACRVRELQVIIRHSRPTPSPRVASAMGWGSSPHWLSGTISRMNRPASIRLRT